MRRSLLLMDWSPDLCTIRPGDFTMMQRLAGVLVASLAIAQCGGGGGSSTPTSPTTTTTTTTPTRIISVTGSLAFGTVNVGSSRSASFTISNTGNSTLTITGIGANTNFVTQSSLSWTSGTIAAGGSQTVTITFTPTATGNFNGTVTVTGDQTSGTNTIGYTAEAVNNTPFSGNWSGTYLVERCDGSGSLQDLFCSTPTGSRAGGIFPIGTALPITLTLTQSGSAVTGTLSLGQVTGTVGGSITNNVLSLTGTVRLSSGGASTSAVIATWSTQVSGNTMTGTQTYNVSISGVPGTLLMTTRFSNVTK
jgi:hypothetical protein